ncbi:MAG: ABC transporter ATP-binding protein [Candidatus Izemoplasmatales bacterium]|nr:ABC transporter ATP-binding protein [Candidatus Izemoplasmatales bacterium]
MKKNINYMIRLIKLIQPIYGYLFITIFTGFLGFVSASLIPILGVVILLVHLDYINIQNIELLYILLMLSGLLRGLLRYAEHYFGHYVAFKTLALFRDHLFGHLRKIAPTNILSKEKGELVSMVSSDIETLEVFYAHTIAPVMIAFLMLISLFTSLTLITSFLFSIPVLIMYLLISFILPRRFHIELEGPSTNYREIFSSNNSLFLESMQGINQIRYLNAFEEQEQKISKGSIKLEQSFLVIKKKNIHHRLIIDFLIYATITLSLLLGIILSTNSNIEHYEAVLGVIIVISSFGPFIALSALPSTLNQTMASAKRVFALLDEKPLMEENIVGKSLHIKSINMHHINYQYDERVILKDLSTIFPKQGIVGIYGESGSGKSTLLKILMRYFDPNQGEIVFNNENLKNLNTKSIRKNIAFLDQETYIFEDTFKSNIILAKPFDSNNLNNACKIAQLQSVVDALPNGYDTVLGNRYYKLSSGEQQRVGLARAFYWDARVLLLDEPTSNVDSLNETMILDALVKEKTNRLIIIISHRRSTLSICDDIYELRNGSLVKYNNQ